MHFARLNLMRRFAPPAQIYSQVVGTKGDTTPSVYVVFDDSRYLVNCGEAHQRLSIQHSLKLARLKG